MLTLLPLLMGCPPGLQTGETGAEELPPLNARATVDELVSDVFLNLVGSRSERYSPPTEAELETMREAVAGALTGSVERVRLNGSGFDLTRIEGDSRRIFVLQEIGEKGHAVMLFDPGASQNLIVEAPHIGFETEIYVEAAALFQTLGARALILNGAHRCANEAPSGCDGTSAACGDPDWFRISDSAHFSEGHFQLFHEVATTTWSDDLVVQLHGFGWNEGEPVSFVSDGTNVVDPSSVGARFADLLDERLPDPFRAGSCNREADASIARLCGTTNTQGRFLNGSADTCDTAATVASGRFLHIEQALALRRSEGEVHRGQVIDAVRALLVDGER